MKKIITIIAALTLMFTMVGCNAAVDTTFKFDRAVISLPNGEIIEGECQSWTDFENSDMIQVKVDGKVYLTHSTNVVLINE